jgi:hypothetical protein
LQNQPAVKRWTRRVFDCLRLSTASIAITGLSSQARDLILAAFAVWLGICVFAARNARTINLD